MREICGNSHECYEIVKRGLSQFFGQYFEDHHSLQMPYYFALRREHFSPIFEYSTQFPYSSFTHYILAVNRRA
jgi:hypothetical protein